MSLFPRDCATCGCTNSTTRCSPFPISAQVAREAKNGSAMAQRALRRSSSENFRTCSGIILPPTDGWAILENNSSLVRSVRFVKDTLHGERISEEQATRLNSNFWPVRPAPPVEPPPEEEAPATDPGPKRRRRNVLADSDDEEAPAPAPAPAASSRSARSNRAGKAVVGRICAQHPDRAQNLNPHRRMRQRIARRLSGTLRVRRSCSLLQAKQYYVLLEIRSGYQFQPRSYAQIKHQKWKRSDYADAVLWRLCLDTAADAVHVAFKLLRALPLLSAQLHAEDLF